MDGAAYICTARTYTARCRKENDLPHTCSIQHTTPLSPHGFSAITTLKKPPATLDVSTMRIPEAFTSARTS